MKIFRNRKLESPRFEPLKPRNGSVKKAEPSPSPLEDPVWTRFQPYLTPRLRHELFKPIAPIPFKNFELVEVKTPKPISTSMAGFFDDLGLSSFGQPGSSNTQLPLNDEAQPVKKLKRQEAKPNPIQEMPVKFQTPTPVNLPRTSFKRRVSSQKRGMAEGPEELAKIPKRSTTITKVSNPAQSIEVANSVEAVNSVQVPS